MEIRVLCKLHLVELFRREAKKDVVRARTIK